MGADISPAEILTSGTATAQWLAGQYPPGDAGSCIWRELLREAMTEVGFVLADEAVKIVVASIDWGVTYDKDQARLAADPRRRTGSWLPI